jgi:hypothetical protein
MLPRVLVLYASRHADDLADLPVWLFSVGTFGDRKPLLGPLMKREPKGIDDLRTALQARQYRVFAGVTDRHQHPYLSRLFFHALGGRLGDNRDWNQIDDWADEIAGRLATGAPRAGRSELRECLEQPVLARVGNQLGAGRAPGLLLDVGAV